MSLFYLHVYLSISSPSLFIHLSINLHAYPSIYHLPLYFIYASVLPSLVSNVSRRSKCSFTVCVFLDMRWLCFCLYIGCMYSPNQAWKECLFIHQYLKLREWMLSLLALIWGEQRKKILKIIEQCNHTCMCKCKSLCVEVKMIQKKKKQWQWWWGGVCRTMRGSEKTF